MEKRTLGFVFILLAGVGCIGAGQIVGERGNYSIDVRPGVAESEIANDTAITEYDDLNPAVQEAFRRGLQSDDRVWLVESPDFESSSVVHYNGSYYPTYIVVGDGGISARPLLMMGGAVLLLVGAIGWLLSREGKGQSPW